MIIQSIFISALFLNIISPTKSDGQYTKEDFAVVRSFTDSLQVNYLVFVSDEKNFGLRNFLKHNLRSVVMSSRQLEEMLNAETVTDFFATATMVVSKESLNYTYIFQRLSEKHFPAWVAFGNSLKPLQHFYIPMNTDFYTVQYTLHTVIINKAYHVKPGLNITLKPIGIWPRGNVDSITINRSRTYDFGGVTLGMLHFLDDECISLKPILMLDRIECFHQEIIIILADKLNFRIRKITCPERVFPYNYPNGTLSDLFTMLKRDEVDFSSASYIVTNYRLAEYDYAWPIFTSKSMLYIKERKQSVWGGYLRPIHKYLWQAICVWIIVVGILNQLFQECYRNKFKPGISLLPDLIKSIFKSLQVFCSQGLSDMPKRSSGRLLFIMSFILFVILYQVYSGFLISFLMIDVPYIPFTDINGFFRSGKYKLLSLNTGFHNYFTNKIINDFKKDPAKFKILPELLPGRPDEGIKILCKSRRLTYVEFRENIVMHEIPCKIIELPRPMLYQSIGIGFPKYSPYREPIQIGVIDLNTAGILHRMRKQLFSYVHLKEKEISEEEYVKVSFIHVVSVFFLLTVGMVFAWLIFILEHLFILSIKLYRKNNNRKAKANHNLKIFNFQMGRNLFACIFLRWPKLIFRKEESKGGSNKFR